MSYSASRIWVSREKKEIEAWFKIQKPLQHVAPRSPFVPKTFEDWVAHKATWMGELANRGNKVVARRAAEIAGRVRRAPVGLALGGKKLPDGLALVLARGTIWVPLQKGGHPGGQKLAPWPSYEELKHEGDDRSKSGYSRFPPLPRDPGNETVNWKQRAPTKQCPFDEVGRPVLAVDGDHEAYLESEMLPLVGSDLLSELGL
ncbi:hypothetical protein AJ79_09455 [Helicocarpus griseus UAMH5409]|uniref:Uncharacterized protein n=1 Tax=Helicocarpus griseus UAMH5409 TaxID=1447875 RepID=A0A2B7WJG8_9EURO|nr:hypothetical protein AJ79_09455 [Helicocarpus griseus UAMH5409]